jgi:hypothetical protein
MILYKKNHADNTYSSIELTPTEKDKVKLFSNYYIILLSLNWAKEEGDDSKKISSINTIFYPYFFSTANGHSNDLINVLGPFRMLPLGPISRSLLIPVQKGSFEDFFEMSENFIVYKDLESFQSVKQKIENEEIKSNIKFKDLYVQRNDKKDYSSLIDALASSYRAILLDTNNKFFSFDIFDFSVKTTSLKQHINTDIPNSVLIK